MLAYLRQDYDAIPALRFMRVAPEALAVRAAAIAEKVARPDRITVAVVDGESLLGGGSAPGAALPTKLAAVSCASMTPDELAAHLRANDPPVIARVEEGKVLLDLRTVFPEQDAQIVAALNGI